MVVVLKVDDLSSWTRFCSEIEIALSRELLCIVEGRRYLNPTIGTQQEEWCNRAHESRSYSPTERRFSLTNSRRELSQPITAPNSPRIDVTRKKRKAWSRDRTRSRKLLNPLLYRPIMNKDLLLSSPS